MEYTDHILLNDDLRSHKSSRTELGGRGKLTGRAEAH